MADQNSPSSPNQNPYSGFFQRLTRLFRSGTTIRRKVKGYDYRNQFERQVALANQGWRGGVTPFGQHAVGYNALGQYGQIDRFARYQEFIEAESVPEVATALSVLADETCASDENGKSFHVFTDNPEVRKALDELFNDVCNIEYNLRFWVRNMLKYGDMWLYHEVMPDYGVINIMPLPPVQVEREEGYDKKDPCAVRFRWQGGSSRYLENWQVSHFRMLGNDQFYPYGECHEATTRVLTSTGVKEIQHIKPGDSVSTFDHEKLEKRTSKVLGVKNSGAKDCWTLRTRHETLTTTKNHQILTWTPDQGFFFKKTLDFKKGDWLITGREHILDQAVKVDKTRPIGKNFNGYWNNSVNIPEYVTQDFARLFGFLIGDGWIANNAVFFANGVHSEQNKVYSDLLLKFSGRTPRAVGPKYGQTVCSCKALAVVLKRMGLNSDAHGKRIPDWVFGASRKIQRAFVDGLHDADGSEFVDEWNCKRRQLELCNLELVKDFKALLSNLGLKSGQVGSRQRKASSICGIPIPAGTYHYLYWFDSPATQYKKHIVPEVQDVVFSRLNSIEFAGAQDTWDIYVEDPCHTFFANNVVTHNSILDPARRIIRSLIMAEDAMLTYRIARAPERLVFYIDTGGIPPNDVPSYMGRAQAALKSNVVVDKQTGRLDYRNNPMSILDNFYIPTRGGNFTTKVESIAGGQNVSAVEDVEYLQNKLFSALQVPKSYLNFGEDLSSKATLSLLDVRVSRTISVIQKVVIGELNKLAMIHLYAKGFDGEDLVDFDLRLSNPSTIAMQQKLELWAARMNIAGTAKEVSVVDEEWIQKNILGLTNDEISKMLNGRRRDKAFAAELESITPPQTPPEAPEPSRADLFSQGSYEVPGAGIPKEPVDNDQPAGVSQEPHKPLFQSVSDLAKLPVKPSGFMKRHNKNVSRHRGYRGAYAQANPDHSAMLSPGRLSTSWDPGTAKMGRTVGEGVNPSLEELAGGEPQNLPTLAEIRELLQPIRAKITREVRSMFEGFDSKTGGATSKKKTLSEGDEVVVLDTDQLLVLDEATVLTPEERVERDISALLEKKDDEDPWS